MSNHGPEDGQELRRGHHVLAPSIEHKRKLKRRLELRQFANELKLDRTAKTERSVIRIATAMIRIRRKIRSTRERLES